MKAVSGKPISVRFDIDIDKKISDLMGKGGYATRSDFVRQAVTEKLFGDTLGVQIGAMEQLLHEHDAEYRSRIDRLEMMMTSSTQALRESHAEILRRLDDAGNETGNTGIDDRLEKMMKLIAILARSLGEVEHAVVSLSKNSDPQTTGQNSEEIKQSETPKKAGLQIKLPSVAQS